MKNRGLKRIVCVLLVIGIIIAGLVSCKSKEDTATQEAQKQLMAESFQTTAKIKYKDLETVATIYKKPMNCAQVTFESPDSLKDMKLTFFTDRVDMKYKEMDFTFDPDGIPGKAAAKLILSAFNTAMEEEGMSIEQTDTQVILHGQMEEGEFQLVLSRETGNILKLVIPESQLEMEIINFKILE
ncbi:hypothetical protein [Youxingia wuxianensis]|uniref:Lipoprotein n=1 Tax=Youxingia wuxianensis TaxID=2763678 RepID=A0A926IH64_9FIRM|nr:hypothetical protein [Youxingia wuxianensis]MBC8584971.1 hypothetical protein [Youxingia wuxianensis]